MLPRQNVFRNRGQRVMKTLPPLEEVLRGSVFVRSLRCGKPGCHCASGEGHRVAYLSVTHPGGRTEQISLPADLVATPSSGSATTRLSGAPSRRSPPSTGTSCGGGDQPSRRQSGRSLGVGVPEGGESHGAGTNPACRIDFSRHRRPRCHTGRQHQTSQAAGRTSCGSASEWRCSAITPFTVSLNVSTLCSPILSRPGGVVA
jgi:hypothetical protein